MLTLSVGEAEYNKILHDLLKLSEMLIAVHFDGNDDAFRDGLNLLGDVRERMLEIVANND